MHENSQGYERWEKIVSEAKLFSVREKFQTVISHFGLKWDRDMEIVFKTWQKARNPLVHDTTRADRTEGQFKQSVINESRIAGAINVVLLKLFGYSGLVRESTFEDTHRRI